MAIGKKELDITIAEAARFISAAQSLRDIGAQFTVSYLDQEIEYNVYEGGPLAAYVKRASMDLSKALANIRKNK